MTALCFSIETRSLFLERFIEQFVAMLAQKHKQFRFAYSFHNLFLLGRKLKRWLPNRWSHASSPPGSSGVFAESPSVFFDGRTPLNRDGSSCVRKRREASSWQEASRRSSEGTCLLVLLEPGLPADGAGRLLGAGIATLAHAASGFARQEDREDGPVDFPLIEPDLRQLS